jgi:alpha-ketoglutarate-dependent 2,4-dichlorophenoxyacetate dioxygenase
MIPNLKQVGRTFAAKVTGVDLRTRLDPATKDWIEDALAHYGVLALGPQKIDDDHQGSTRALVLLGNALWHTDGSQMQPPTRVSALHARVLPPSPPPTEYADMRAAWDALPGARQQEIEDLHVVHNFFWSREQIGMGIADFSEETVRLRPPVTHPLVRINPITGRKSLYLASHASHPIGWPIDEGRALIKGLIAHATRPDFVYSHDWEPDELVMWDDRWTMHRSTPYKELHPRKMRWCGARETEPV